MIRKKQIILCIIVLSINFLLDRVTKIMAVNYLQGRETLSYFYDTVMLRYTENTGAFLSMGAGWPDWLKYILLLAIPILLCLYGLYYCAFKLTDKKLIIAFVCIVGGGLGNLVDRLIYDFHVVDFLNFGISSLRTGILNVADMSVTFAVIYLLVIQFKTDKNPEN